MRAGVGAIAYIQLAPAAKFNQEDTLRERENLTIFVG